MDAWLEERTRASHRAVRDLADRIPAGTPFILVDEGFLPIPADSGLGPVHRLGLGWDGPPREPRVLQDFEELRTRGARFAVFAWPALWWLDHYPELARRLGEDHSPADHAGDLRLFALSPVEPASPASPP